MDADDVIARLKDNFLQVKPSAKPKFKCLLCAQGGVLNGTFSGNFANYKDHVWAAHREIAIDWGMDRDKMKIKKEINEEKIRQHFNPIKTDAKAMFQCLLCYKELCGGFCNFKDHLWSAHRIAAVELGVEDPKKKVKTNENLNLNDFLVGVDDSHDFDNSSTSFQDAPGTSVDEYLEPVPLDPSFPTLRTYFENIHNTSKKMFRCLMCAKELRGGFRNFQDHMWSSHNSDAVNMGVEPPKKKQKPSEGERKLKPVELSVVNSDLNEIRNAYDESAIKTYFKILKNSKKPKFSCLLCYKELCGNFTNFKDHLWSSHNDFARQFGVYPKKKQPMRENYVTVKEEANDEDEEIFEEPAKETFDETQEDADDGEYSSTFASESQKPNDKVLESYFKNLPDESKPMFSCEICKRHLCGTISNFKIHMWSSHSEMMLDFGFKLKGAMRKRKYHLLKQEGGESSEEETVDQPELKKYFERIRTSKKTMFRCLFCSKTLCGNYNNFQQHVWSMHQDEANKYNLEMPKTKAKLLQNLRPRRKFNMFDSADNSESSSDDEERCRLCEEKQGLSSIFKKRRGRVISDMVLEIVPEINIVKGDGYSQEICKNCLETVVSACELRNITMETDKKLRGEPEEQYFEDESYDYYNPLEFNVKDEPIDTPVVSENLSTFQIVESFHVKEEFVDVSAKPVKVTINGVCKICRLVFHDSETLSRHMRNCFKCDICDNAGVRRTYNNKLKLASHMEACHIERPEISEVDMSLRLYFEPDRTTSRRLFRCLMCERDFSGTFTNFKFHMWSCHNEASRSFGLVEPRKQKRGGEVALNIEVTVNQLHESGIDGLRIYYEPIRHSTKRLFKCLLCGKELCGGVTNFRQHIWSSHNQIGREFGMDAPSNKSKTAIRYHRSAAESPEDYKCEFCHKLYKTFYSCHMHKKRDHVEIMFPLECEHCEKRFETKEKLNDHVFITHDNFRCKVCKLQFETRQAYNLHSFIHCEYVEEFIDPDQKYDCALCAFSCESDEVLQGHLVTHASDFFERNYMVCIRCSITFKNFEELVNHTNDHNLRITHRCLRCQKVFPYGDKLLRHLKRYQDSYTCDYCGHCESGKSRLEEHMMVKHLEVICFLCPFCGESKSSEHSLKNHIRTRHEMERKFQCDKCPKAFSSAAFYRNHQSVHTNVKSFACTQCTKTFKSLRNLKRHQNFHDPSKLIYKYFCDYDNCGKKFYTNYGLNRHILTHTGIRPWVCDFAGCDRSFSQSQDLNKHRRLHVGSECTYSCDYDGCSMSFKYIQDLRLHLGVHYQPKQN